jgi:hypothetical protein
MTREQQYQRAYKRLYRRLSERGELASWTPLRIGNQIERAPRWFRKAVTEAQDAQRPAAAHLLPVRRSRPRARRERRSRRVSATRSGDPPDTKPASGSPLRVHFTFSAPEFEGSASLYGDEPGGLGEWGDEP